MEIILVFALLRVYDGHNYVKEVICVGAIDFGTFDIEGGIQNDIFSKIQEQTYEHWSKIPDVSVIGFHHAKIQLGKTQKELVEIFLPDLEIK